MKSTMRANQTMRCAGAARVCALLLLTATLSAGCLRVATGGGSFDRTLKVTGPLRMEVRAGAGSVDVKPGLPGQAHIHAEMVIHAAPWESPRHRIEDLQTNPPITQRGDEILVGFDGERTRFVRFTYTITVPRETELRVTSGSGPIEVRGLRGPVQLTTGSGGVAAMQIDRDAEAQTGSGPVRMIEVAGEGRASAGSGTIEMEKIRGEVRANTGSGGITVRDSPGRITAKTGSGMLRVTGSASDLRLTTSSGTIDVEGNPGSNGFWELHTRSGGIHVDVPPTASFRLDAHTGSGHVHSALPITVEEQSRNMLRGRVGKGEARIEARTNSGGIEIR